jgi:hypothetical protein
MQASESLVSCLLKKKQLDNQLERVIEKEYYPISLVDDTVFRRFVHMLCPGYQIPRMKTLTNNLISILYQKTVRKVKAELNVAIAACLTADRWTTHPIF